MTNAAQQTTPYDWVRAYTALSRLGCVTDAIRSCESAWGRVFEGDAAAVEAIKRLPEYGAYAHALRHILCFPLVLYRVTPRDRYERWCRESYSHPVAASLCPEFARLVHEVYPEPHGPLVLITGTLTDPEAVLMRGRVEGYELVLDSGRVSQIDVRAMRV